MSLADAPARKLARTEFVDPVVLVAGAGTGKTSTLVARIVAWSLGPGWEKNARPGMSAENIAATTLGRIAAITFTERAATEMGQRVVVALQELHRGDTPNGDPLGDIPLEDAERVTRSAALLVRIDALRIETIHAFCRRTLAGDALEAGLHPEFEIDGEGRIVAALIEETLARWVDDAYGADADEEALALLARGCGPERLAETLTTLVQSGLPSEALALDGFDADTVREFAARQAERLRPLQILLAQKLGETTGKFVVARRVLDILERTLDLLPRVTVRVAREDLVESVEFQKAVGTLGDWTRVAKPPEKRFTKALAELLSGHEQDVSTWAKEARTCLRHIAGLDPDLHRQAARVLAPLLADVRARMAKQGIATFDDLLHGTARLLAESESARDRVRGGIDQLLVDEVQDTDPVQFDIVASLALEGEAADRPGLFIVGDPKQCIYGFRSADLAAYEDFIERVRGHDGRVESLTVNFRSTPEILDEVEHVMSVAMVPQAGVQPEFQPLTPGRTFDADQRRPVEYWPVGLDEEEDPRNAGKAREVEAAAVAEDMLTEHAAGRARWGDMAILMRISTAQETYLEALREREIPYVVERDRSYFKRREVIDAIATVSAIADVHDHLSLLAFLRSPAVGLPDAALLPLWSGGFPGLMSQLDQPREDILAKLDALIAYVEPDVAEAVAVETVSAWPTALKAAVRDLAELRASMHRDPADVFVARLRKATRQEEVEASRFLGAHRLANLERFYRRLLDDLSRNRRGGLHAILREHRRGVRDEFSEPESAPGDETLDAIRVMTIHRAKGLDFSQVYVVNNHHGSGNRGAPDCDVARIDGRWETRLLGASSLRFSDVIERRQLQESAEIVRTLYVAMTRPKTRLVLSGNWPHGRSAGEHAKLIALSRPAPWAPDRARDADEEPVRWNILEPTVRERTRGTHATETGVDVGRALEGMRRLDTESEIAADREAHRLLESITGRLERDEEPARYAIATAIAPEVARVVGTAMHALLEIREPGRPMTEGLPLTDTLIDESLPDAESRTAARGALRDLAASADASAWLTQLDRLDVVGREVPVILPHDDGTESVLSGAIDLLYRDGEEWVVADYKTDRPGPLFLTEQARTHEPQLRRYAEAVRAGLGLEDLPRGEIWFLAEDAIERVF